MEQYIVKNGKKLHYGYTTGSCATGAAKAAVKMLFTGKKSHSIKIDTPKGWEIDLEVKDIVMNKEFVSCGIEKDSGDDPDITNGIKIYARAEKMHEEGIEITGGLGIGKITKHGLAVDVGKYAINPTPMKTIYEEVKSVLPPNKGVRIQIYAPEGVDIAKKTFNPKLGIVGGISIIGTTGIVEPMSEEAFKESLAIEFSILKEQGVKKIILAPGNYGRDFVKDLHLPQDILVKTSNFIGFMMDKAVEYDIEKILWVGHIGKMVKVAAGIFHTHSKIADARMEILAANCAQLGGSQGLTNKIMNTITTEEAIEYIMEENMDRVFPLLAEKISKRCEERVHNEIEVGTLIFSQAHGKLGICPKGKKLLEELKYE